MKILNLTIAIILLTLSQNLSANTNTSHAIAMHGEPKYNEDFLKVEDFQLIIQVNGKVRGKEIISVDADQNAIEKLSKENENVKKVLANQPIKKVIYVKEKLINFVI